MPITYNYLESGDYMKKVILGMSGGVDSSVSALLLKEAGYDVVGLFMKNWSEEDNSVCTATEDANDARRVCSQLDIPFYTIDFEDDYRKRVFSYFLNEYENGRTPNPDVMCNQEIKFNAFLDYALSLDGDYIAMGHYAQVDNNKGLLYRGKDANKDQSYFLSRIESSALKKTIFPIGHLEKSEVRELAEKAKLVTARKKDSTGICFIGERDFDKFLDDHLYTQGGHIIDVDSGKQIGKHTGLIHYTNGQRKGLGIGGVGSGEPWFVCGKNHEKNQIYVCQGKNHPANYSIGLIGEDLHWIKDEPTDMSSLTAKFRYRQEDVKVKLKVDGSKALLSFEPFAGITPGQVAVLYDKELCLGSMIISQPLPMDDQYSYLNKPKKPGA